MSLPLALDEYLECLLIDVGFDSDPFAIPSDCIVPFLYLV